jgi:ring-1,2-phenylacetyl-CoA epoxidase subunit PaaD
MNSTEERVNQVWDLIRQVMDPELPFLSVDDMGMIRGVRLEQDQIVVTLTPTYSGCPATDVIATDVRSALHAVEPTGRLELALSPPWTTDWISDRARHLMAQHGIAPPEGPSADRAFLTGQGKTIPCPRCKSTHTTMVSAFGSTACKAHFTCDACLEPFEHFKCI